MRQNILERYPSTSLSVYVVWMPMLATDARSEWESAALPDARVRHFWDEERVVGQWLADQDLGGTGYSGIVWDAFFVFGPEASWDDAPAPLLGAGAPVIGDTDELESALVPLVRT